MRNKESRTGDKFDGQPGNGAVGEESATAQVS